MSVVEFNRDSMARWYASQNIQTDPGIEVIYYLPENAGDREIRFVYVNKLLGDRTDDVLEPIDFGIDRDTANAHRLIFLDVTPEQWKRIEKGSLSLPLGWSLKNKIQFDSHE